MTYSLTWDLDVFFKGGSSSEEFSLFLESLNQDIKNFDAVVSGWRVRSEEKDQHLLINIIELFAKTGTEMRQAGAFISCLEAQNTKDAKAHGLRAQVTQYSAAFQDALTKLDQKLVQLDEEFYQKILKTPPLDELHYILNERRERARRKLSVEEESLINQLAVDGYHGWSQMYDTIVGSIKIPFKENGEINQLSVGQAANKFSDPDRNVRRGIFEAWENAWGEKSEVLARTLNHLVGFRLSIYEKRDWQNVLQEPLEINRMQKETLESMWEVIANNKEPLVKFLNRKAELLGVEKLSWYDLDAPLPSSAAQNVMRYEDGAEFILKHFSKFGSRLAAFTKTAFEDSWIEAEDRQNKRPGGFCTGFPLNEQSRIFMTYSGTPSNVSTLAHELGHAFHSYALKDIHPLKRSYAMNVAETASTFAEMIVSDAAVKEAKDDAEKLALLEDKIQRTVALLMNIHARFLFETSFYEERKQGMVSAARLNEIMIEAQKEAYGDALAEYHPSFWASKLHFYITGVPFYNFPYTFGFLFSLGIYAKALEEGEGFEEKYIALLQDTGSMTVEDLAKKHLKTDLTGKDFWVQAVGACLKDIEEFLELTDKSNKEA
ncbi:M3 family oligoendopeptidase [Peribacillus cavernae]|uniref:M3 family oligoendopeptidase n=1 Tax=Peribacillus cavernae TaxID=1674310 RepID=A0A433HWD7_9BACI|nr:M3 family oligoendopeptidase [Peribacillus cavernae]MDQ0218222.1 pepF/M3 family oligoendopeptidase [Peribacillus cavernae]RUQ32643.1 M3 family oligoendopeptidase [Peribacillus cavernae]